MATLWNYARAVAFVVRQPWRIAMRSTLLWVIGVPVSVIVLLNIFHVV
jgi:hypothetical protein